MNFFDSKIMVFLNGFARKSFAFDSFMHVLSTNYLIKGGIFVTMLWWVWFRNGENNTKTREHIISMIIASFSAILIARFLALTLPFRPRPLKDLEIFYVIPYSMTRDSLEVWSAFPSDHAALFFAFAAGLMFVSRFMGVFALLYAFFIICFPRMYLGLHYPTDIIAGAMIGVGMAFLANTAHVNNYMVKPTMRWHHDHPSSFYAVFFLLTFSIATLFDSIRRLINSMLVIFKG
jgi:undecaprenyl-diphosphatase